MIFTIKNVRNGLIENLNSSQFKSKIINETESTYEDSSVLSERTGLRPESLDSLFNELKDLIVEKDIYLVTALYRINSNKHTRYMILIDGDNYNPKITNLIHDYVPIYSVSINNQKETTGVASKLSHWFRNTMGRGFSFSNIDYLIINKNFDKSILVEEKIGKIGISSLGYGQLISYKELITDVIKEPNLLLFIFSIQDAELDSTVKFYTCNKDSFIGNNLKNKDLRQTTLKNLSNKIKKIM